MSAREVVVGIGHVVRWVAIAIAACFLAPLALALLVAPAYLCGLLALELTGNRVVAAAAAFGGLLATGWAIGKVERTWQSRRDRSEEIEPKQPPDRDDPEWGAFRAEVREWRIRRQEAMRELRGATRENELEFSRAWSDEHPPPVPPN